MRTNTTTGKTDPNQIGRRAEIELKVKGIKTLHDSFRDYVALKALHDGSEQQADGSELRDAQKGVIFLSLPPVLHLHPRRHEYDTQCGAIVKVGTAYAPEKLSI